MPGDTISTISARLNVPKAVLMKLNTVRENSVLEKELVVPETVGDNNEGIRAIVIGDLMDIDFERIAQMNQPYTFLIQYCTVKGVALGKLTLTEYEIIFEPLNPNLKGFVSQECILISR